MPIDATRQLKLKREFNQLINMSTEEMQAHFSSADSDLASLSPKLSPQSGKALGKRALVLKQKPEWEDDDFDEADNILRPLRWQLGRKVPMATADGVPTLFAIALRNRGHDPMRYTAIPKKVEAAETVATTVSEAEISLDKQREMIRTAIQDVFTVLLPPEQMPDGRLERPYVWVKDVFPESQTAIVEYERDNALYRVGYSWLNGEVIVDPATITEVQITYEPVQTITHGELGEVVPGELTGIAEAEEGKAPRWFGIMIKAGTAKNRAKNGEQRIYTADMLKTAVAEGVFDNVPGYSRNDAQHLKEEGWTKVGQWGKAVWDDTKQAVTNTFTWVADKYPALFDKKLRLAIAEGKQDDLPGCSITGDVLAPKTAPHQIAKIAEIRSCDWISFSSAGGGLLAIQESLNSPDKEKSMITALKALEAKGLTVPAALKTRWEKLQVAEGAAADFMLAQLEASRPNLFKVAGMKEKLAKDEEMLVTLFSEFMAAEGVATEDPPADPATDPASVSEAEKERIRIAAREAEEESLRAETRRLAVEGLIANSGLNEIEQRTIRRQFENQPFSKAAIQEAIQDAKDRMAAYGQQTAKRTRIDVDRDAVDKLQQAANDFFFSDVTEHSVREAVREAHGENILSKDYRGSMRSLRGLYILGTGDTNLTFDLVTVSESVDPATFTKILQNAMNLRLLRDYTLPSVYDAWRLLFDVVPLADFKTQEVMRTGYYGALQIIGRDDAYPELTQGGKLDNSYTPDTRGGMISIHRKDIINDNVGEIRRQPAKISIGTKLDLSAFVWGLILDNPALGDGVDLFHADHGNLLTGNAAAAGLAAATLVTMDGKLRDQTLPGRTDKLMLPTKYVIIPANATMRTAAYAVIAPAFGQQNAIPTFAQSLSAQGIECPHASDADDWYVATDKSIQEIGEVGFFQGKEEPEILVADNQLAGALFTHDKVQYKVRHEYGGSIVDYRGIAKSAVT